MGVPVMSALPADHLHRIYAGVLGKLIGVYMGRPFENWTFQDIQATLGPIHYYVHEKFKVPLVVIDDDVSGTFAFVRALEEHDFPSQLTSQDVGKTWLNQVIEKKTIFWWGGNGISTEHTTFLNLKKGIKPPMSGSIQCNGKTLAEQIGAQIFIDGWAMVAPGNTALAAKLAEAAARVSHDGVAVDAAVLWAVMEAEAFVSKDVDHLLDTGLSFIPEDSSLRKLVADVRKWAKDDQDWQKTRQRIEEDYGYDKYGGICHMVPNHGIMIMALLYGGHSFTHAMHIINTSGWDTDCNSGNVGCLVAIMHGLEGFQNDQGLDWRGPLADQALISSADAAYSINDAVRITYDLANIAAKLAGQRPPDAPKGGAQFHFSLPGSVQGFQTKTPSTIKLTQGQDGDIPALGIQIDHNLTQETRDIEAMTQTFTPKDVLAVSRDYEMMGSPLIYPGQTVKTILRAANENETPIKVSIRIKAYDYDDSLVSVDSEAIELVPGKDATALEFTVPQKLENKPIQQVGLTLASAGEKDLKGTVWLHSLRWTGVPNTTFKKPERKVVGLESHGPSMWQRAWVSSIDKVHYNFGPSFFLAHDRGEGLHYQGSRDWTDYSVSVSGFTVNVGGPVGVVARVQGLNRWMGVLLSRKENGRGYAALVKARDGERKELVNVEYEWELDQKYEITLRVEGTKIVAQVNGEAELSAEDGEYKGGAAGFVLMDGSVSADSLTVSPI